MSVQIASHEKIDELSRLALMDRIAVILTKAYLDNDSRLWGRYCFSTITDIIYIDNKTHGHGFYYANKSGADNANIRYFPVTIDMKTVIAVTWKDLDENDRIYLMSYVLGKNV